MPTFQNRENEKITLPDGRTIFLARSAAVVACVVCLVNDEPYVLMVERGETVDNSGKWCMPCGYLDWDEDFSAAVTRELFEETGLCLDDLEPSRIMYKSFDSPYHVDSSPKSHRQNISHHFGVVLKGPLPLIKTSQGMQSGEIKSVEWVHYKALSDIVDEETYAFNHNMKAHMFLYQMNS